MGQFSRAQAGQFSQAPKPLIDAALLETVELLDETEVNAFVEAASRIDDADAACIALAGVRELPLLSDDKKERRIAVELFPAITLISTLDVLFDGSVALGWSQAELRKVAYSLRWRSNFAPPRGDPRAQWYAGLLTGN